MKASAKFYATAERSRTCARLRDLIVKERCTRASEWASKLLRTRKKITVLIARVTFFFIAKRAMDESKLIPS